MNVGLVDFIGLAGFAHGWALNQAWPATPYFPAGYPLLLAPFGYLGELLKRGGVLEGGYILSACGATLLLAAALRLARHWGANHWWSALAVALAWLAPEFRVTAGSPAPDMLASGAGVGFLAFACEAWDGRLKQRSAILGAACAAAAATFLRYHFLLLVVPVALILLLRRPARAVALSALFGTALSLAINHGAYWSQYREPLRGCAQVQVRTGLCIRYGRPYSTPPEMFAAYPEFIQRCSAVPMLGDYSLGEIAGHAVRNWLLYLRRPACFLALGSVVLLLVARRRLSGSMLLGGYWLPLYTLALSPAYYVPRAAVLPTVVAVAMYVCALLALCGHRHGPFRVGAVALLLAGFALTSHFAWADYRLRLASAELAGQLPALMRVRGITHDATAYFSGYVCNLEDNPWFERGNYVGRTWFDDPAIKPTQFPGRRALDLNRVASGTEPDIEAVLTLERGSDYARWLELAGLCWEVAERVGQGEIWIRR